MTFLYVDDIAAITPGCIRGSLSLDHGLPFRHPRDGGADIVAPSVLCEAILQLASWQLLQRNGFSARPVFLLADRITHHRDVTVGGRLDLEVRLASADAESARFSGSASLGGVTVHTVDDCVFSFLPLARLEDPDACRERFAALTSVGGARRADRKDVFAWSTLRGETLQIEQEAFIHQRLRLDPDLDFYAEHFPRYPVTPAVILNEIAGQAAVTMLAEASPPAIPSWTIAGCKIRDFVRPGDTIDIKVRRAQGAEAAAAAQVEVIKAGRRIMHARWQRASAPEDAP